MYTYKIGYGSYEESEFVELQHENEYSNDQLHEIVVIAIKAVLTDLIHLDEYFGENGPNYQDIHDQVIEKLLLEHDFRQVDYRASWSVFGWPSLTDPKDWEGQRDNVIDKIFGALPIGLIDAVNDRAKELHDKIYQEDL
jgi:hypothetical protein